MGLVPTNDFDKQRQNYTAGRTLSFYNNYVLDFI